MSLMKFVGIDRLLARPRAVPRLRMALAALACGLGMVNPARADDDTASVAGLYDGSQPEVGAGLELTQDGRFRYQLAYGALDEWSAGTWTKAGDTVVLQSDPSKAPEFAVSDSGGKSGRLVVKLAVPDGFDPQYFALNLHRKDGSASIADMASGSIDLAMGDNPVVSVRPLLPVMDMAGPEIAVDEGGAELTIRFLPNDLGFVGFSQEAMRLSQGNLELPRHGIVLRFRKVRAEP